MDLARLLVLVIYLCFFVGLAQGADLNRGIENYQATLNGQKTFRDLTPEEQVEVMEVMQLLKSERKGGKGSNLWERGQIFG